VPPAESNGYSWVCINFYAEWIQKLFRLAWVLKRRSASGIEPDIFMYEMKNLPLRFCWNKPKTFKLNARFCSLYQKDFLVAVGIQNFNNW
jgi:hypothetical protein